MTLEAAVTFSQRLGRVGIDAGDDGRGGNEHDGGKSEQHAGEYFMFHAISPILPETKAYSGPMF
jgi:hypothetical protein